MSQIREAIRPTTFIYPEKLRNYLGLEVVIISETFQHTGSFKFRAAYNLAINVPNQMILTASSGNFGQALARACQIVGKSCIVVMPETSAKTKIEAVKSYGAVVDLIDTSKVSRNDRVRELAKQMPEAYVASAYDDVFVIEGNSSLGEEISAVDLDIVISPVGGGGLISGIATGLRKMSSKAEIIGAEPALANDAARSLKEGRLIANEKEPNTIADGARTQSLGKLNWEIIKSEVKRIFEVPEMLISEAVRLYFHLVNLKVEPTGALSLGAVLLEPEFFREKKIGLVVSGGNVDCDVYLKILNGEL